MFGNGKQKELRYRAEEIASEAAEGLDDLRRNARAGAEDVKKQAVNLLHQAADSIRREARQRGASKDMRQSADDVARGLEKAAHYLRRHSFEDMGEDVTKSVRRNPWRLPDVSDWPALLSSESPCTEVEIAAHLRTMGGADRGG